MPTSQTGRGGANATDPDFSTGTLIFSVVVWLVVAVFLALSFGFTERARVLPQFVGVPALLVATVLVVREVRAVLLHNVVATGARPAGENGGDERSRRGEASAFGWLAFLVLAVYVLGMLLGFTVFLLVFLRFSGREKWWLTVAITGALMGIIYFGFADFFGLRLHSGLIGPLLGL